jgi:3-hydroxyisobutyrate dehydrogenase-like beta-hydroxyacid dehydrogenase
MMKPAVAIIGVGAMGSAVGKRLTDNGLTVVTLLDGRSAASVKRAAAAGMTGVPVPQIAKANIVLSIVPPGQAKKVAEQFAAAFTPNDDKPIYVDCNAVNKDTAEEIGMILARADCPFVDAGIIGGPPKLGAPGPIFYLSGKLASAVAELNQFGLECRVLEGGIGAASALKMSYAGITKGLTALASVMILAAARAGTSEALHSELRASQPALLAWFERQVPSMFDKAYRWVAEMDEIAAFVGDDPAGRQMLDSTARLYERLAADVAGAKLETETLARFFK